MKTNWTCAIVSALGPLCLSVPAQIARPNILIIIADDLGVDAVDTYKTIAGSADPARTPNLTALARNGVLFSNAYSQPNCSPTRSSILTGQYSLRHLTGTWVNDLTVQTRSLADRDLTYAEVISDARLGYSQAYLGKWHSTRTSEGLDAPRTVGGFEYFSGTLGGKLADYYRWSKIVDGVRSTATTYATTEQTDDAIGWINRQTGPWLCNLNYSAPHLPFQDPPRGLHTRARGSSPPSDREKYKAMVEAMDAEIGRLLRSIGSLRNTYVIFLGDNGSPRKIPEPPFDPARSKGTPFEAGNNIPLIITGPGVHAPGRQVDALTHVVDLFATTLDLAGAVGSMPPWVVSDSRSLVPLLSGTSASVRDYSYSEIFVGTTWKSVGTNGFATVRHDDYKLIRTYAANQSTDFLFRVSWDRQELLDRFSLGPLQGEDLIAWQQMDAHIAELQRPPPARIVHFGPSLCVGSRGVPRLSSSGRPALGQSYQIVLDNARPNTLTALSVDFKRADFILNPGSGQPSCFLLTPTSYCYFTSTSAAGGASAASPVFPQDPALIYQTFYHQWLVLDPVNSLGFTTTNAAAVIVGY